MRMNVALTEFFKCFNLTKMTMYVNISIIV